MRDSIALLVCLTGVPWLIRNTIARNRVGVLLYHDPAPDVFERHLAYLSARYNIVPYSDVVSALTTRDWSGLPRRALAIHIDDGYRRNHQLKEICARHGVRPTLYLCSHIAGTHRHFWSRLMQGRSKRLRLVSHKLLLEKLRAEAAFSPDDEFPTAEALSAGEIHDMLGIFDFQVHGRYHFSLVTMDDATLEEEIHLSRRRIEELTGRACEHFSLAYGDHTQREIDALRQAGYKTIRTTLPGWVSRQTSPLRLPILADVPGESSVRALQVHLTGLPRFLKRVTYLLITRHLYAVRQRVLMKRVFFSPERV